jgi:hypothetical protein
MAIKVSIHFDGSSATYEVKNEIDGIYKAILVGTPPPPQSLTLSLP